MTEEGQGVLAELDEAECLRLIEPGGVGRIAYTGRFGPVVFPVNYRLVEGEVVFRTVRGGPLDEDLRTGIQGAEYQVAFEVDEFDAGFKEGWSVLIQGHLHHVDAPEERAEVLKAGVEAWAGGEREAFLRVRTTRMTGRRIHHGA